MGTHGTHEDSQSFTGTWGKRIAAPACDVAGNLNGVDGTSACGTLGYAVSDAHYAKRVVAIIDHIVPYPANSIDISQEWVDFIVEVDSIGDP